MTLVEFLLARIAEDEAKIPTVASERARFTSAPINQGVDLSWLTGIDIFVSPDRLRAECEAKRRIVEADPRYGNPWNGCGDDCEAKAHDWALRNLALPYADHPDYREEWRP